MTKQQLAAINKFTRRELSEDELYVFPVILCDNDIDRDGECFSDDALEKLCSLFVGKTGIFDHDPKSSGQNARIFSAEICSEPERLTGYGTPYKFLKAYAYMVRTDDNRSLIAEIDAGIKKEVSISCAASERICSICGCDRAKVSCAHTKGKRYGDRLCHIILGGITDAYEWSFVAVPAQVGAGVSKQFCSDNETIFSHAAEELPEAEKELRRDIRRLAFVCGGLSEAGKACEKAASMSAHQLIELKKSLEKRCPRTGTEAQLLAQEEDESVAGFTM